MVKHNNVIPNGHIRKHGQNYVKTWFNLPARKTRRRIAGQKKAVKIFPWPTAGPLRPMLIMESSGSVLPQAASVAAAHSLLPRPAHVTEVPTSEVQVQLSAELTRVTFPDNFHAATSCL
ncbi:uncharacterized protein LOC130732793 [Lotus japonicus]|uniref:uncharacterized protein LOC130732793 n=1 Tax=Lotus japonicus TaxID=34305 RepID=UPI00258D4BB1|nr:uncharacterized protein LOC130732793 [Lotus japonicus]